MIFSQNGDLYRIRAWKELGRRALPFAVLSLMVLTIPVVVDAGGQVSFAWAGTFVVAIILANVFAVPAEERRAIRAYRNGEYEAAAEIFEKLAEEKELPRYHMLLGAALGSSGKEERSIRASDKAIELDPRYGIAYYNRALVQRRQGRRGKAKNDLKKALETDLPRRYRNSARNMLEESGG
jgi:tetratricopeptide (TPR) repeat protein